MEKVKLFFKTKLGIALIVFAVGGATAVATYFGCDVCVDVLSGFMPAPEAVLEVPVAQ